MPAYHYSTEVPLPTETVVLLDFDDTLLCSTHLQSRGIHLATELYDLSSGEPPAYAPFEVREAYALAVELRELENCVLALLRAALSSPNHRVHIVTNAEAGWVQLASARFLPRILPLLDYCAVISARTSFEHLFPDSPLRWKYFAMREVLVGSGFFGTDGRPGVMKHVISLGDSHVEREAVRAVCKNVPSTRTKSVKFAERPTIEQVRRQLELVVQTWPYICTHDADLDLQLTVTLNPANPPTPVPPMIAVQHSKPAKSDLTRIDDAKDADSTLQLTPRTPHVATPVDYSKSLQMATGFNCALIA